MYMKTHRKSKIHLVAIMVCLLAATAFAAPLAVREVVIDKHPPERPYTKIAADFNGDGLPDIAIGGANGPLVWYAYPSWTKRLVAEGGYQTVEGEAADIDSDGDQDIVWLGERSDPEASDVCFK